MDERSQVKSKIDSLSAQIEMMENLFNRYFSGMDKLPPSKKLDSLKRDVMRLMDWPGGKLSPADQFMISSFVQKFTSYRMKWEKGVTDIEEGRKKPGSSWYGQGVTSCFSDKTIMFHKTSYEDRTNSEIDKAAKKFVELSREMSGKDYDVAAIKQTLKLKCGEIVSKYGENFTFDVSIENGKVKIKPQST